MAGPYSSQAQPSICRTRQMLEVLEEVFANLEPDPETAGPLLTQLDMEILTPAAS